MFPLGSKQGQGKFYENLSAARGGGDDVDINNDKDTVIYAVNICE